MAVSGLSYSKGENNMKFVEGYDVPLNNQITFVTQQPGASVGTYGAVLFRVSGGTRAPVMHWNATDLEGGLATFPMDIGAGSRYEMVLAAMVTSSSTIAVNVNFQPHPPADDATPVTLDPSEGIPQRLWIFFGV
jgi:hypothetical protein